MSGSNFMDGGGKDPLVLQRDKKPSAYRVKGGNYKMLWKRSLKKMVAIGMMSVPAPFNGFHEMRHNSAITHQNQLEFCKQKAKQIFSWQSKILAP